MRINKAFIFTRPYLHDTLRRLPKKLCRACAELAEGETIELDNFSDLLREYYNRNDFKVSTKVLQKRPPAVNIAS
jgi:hypothetical protein